MLENASSRKPPRCRCYPRGATRQQKCPRSESDPALRRRRRELRRCRHGPVRGRQGWIRTDPGAQVKLSGGALLRDAKDQATCPKNPGGRRRSLFHAVRGTQGRRWPSPVDCWPRRTGVLAHRSPGAPDFRRTARVTVTMDALWYRSPGAAESRRTAYATPTVGASVPESRRITATLQPVDASTS